MSPISLKQLRDLLGNSQLLRTIPEHELELLSGRVRRSQLSRGQLIFMKNDEGTGVMLLVSGRVKIVSVSPSGSEVIHNIISPGQVFVEMALLDGKPRAADAVAAVDSEIVELSRKDFLDVLTRNPEVAIEMMAILCGRIRQATSFVEDAVLLDAGTRLFHRLRALADQYGQTDSDGVLLRIDHGLPQQEIGESVGLTRVSINRFLSHWRSLELIEDGGGYVIVRDVEALEVEVEKGQQRL